MNRHKGWRIWYNGSSWKCSRYGVEMYHATFAGILSMIDGREKG